MRTNKNDDGETTQVETSTTAGECTSDKTSTKSPVLKQATADLFHHIFVLGHFLHRAKHVLDTRVLALALFDVTAKLQRESISQELRAVRRFGAKVDWRSGASVAASDLSRREPFARGRCETTRVGRPIRPVGFDAR